MFAPYPEITGKQFTEIKIDSPQSKLPFFWGYRSVEMAELIITIATV